MDYLGIRDELITTFTECGSDGATRGEPQTEDDMLESITVKNLALIKESEIGLHEGLNILTGETGAGKSIILGSIRLALGERADKDAIRTGAEYALVELVFRSKADRVVECMKQMDLPIESDGSIYISRRIQEGRSVAKCNGETISAKDLRKLAAMLIDIHGQNDTKELLDVRNYRDILDDYGPEELGALKNEMAGQFAAYKKLKGELDDIDVVSGNRDKDISLAEFELNEIENAKLSEGEDDELEDKYRMMKNAGRIAESLSKVSGMLNSDDGTGAMIGAAVRELGSVTQYDTSVSEMADRLAVAEDMITDILRDMQNYMDDMDFSEAEYREIENRLDTINHLKNKYGDSIDKILKYAEDKRNYLEKMTDIDAYRDKLKASVTAAHDAALKTADKLHKLRDKAASDMATALTERLHELSFDNVTLNIPVQANKDNLSSHGMDDVDIEVSFNVGEPVKSLSKVASGGELSRFMLALKEVTAGKDAVETLVFDEIDSGISGKTAWNVSGSMKNLASTHQVIAITHLPQIAARADSHYLIEKRVEGDSTVTDISRLDDNGRIEEIARLLSGGELTDTGIENAKELLEIGGH